MLTCDHIPCPGCQRPIPGVVDRCMYCGEEVTPSNQAVLSPWSLPGEDVETEEAWFADLVSLARVLCAAGEQSIALWGKGAPPEVVDQLRADLARVQEALDTGDEEELAEALESLEEGWSRFGE